MNPTYDSGRPFGRLRDTDRPSGRLWHRQHPMSMGRPHGPDDDRGPGPRGGRRGFGPPPGGGFGPWGFGRGGGGPRAGRGDVRAAIISVLGEGPMHGYQLMREMEERSGGAWRPSPGSVYPILQALEDEELIVAGATSAKRVFQLTDAGRQLLAAHPEYDDWLAAVTAGDTSIHGLRDLMHQVGAATRQVAHAGSARQIEAAKALLTDTRKRLYRLLGEDEPSTEPGGQADREA